MQHFKSTLQRALPVMRALNHTATRGFAGLNLKRKPTRRDLDKYDVVIIGGNLGAILSRHLDDDSHGHYSTMVLFDEPINQQWSMRAVYEQQRASKTDYMPNAKLAINMYTASEVATVEKFFPEENAVQLKSGRRIGYDHLVVAMGLKEDWDVVPGLEAAWADPEHPVYAPKDHPSWRSFQHPYPRWHYNFTHGDAYFYIPPYPYKGEVGGLNFFISDQVWRWYSSYGKLSPKHSFTVINANDNFCKYFDPADQFIKEKIQKQGINVQYGWKLKSVNKDKFEAVWENSSGQTETRPYSQIYSLIPSKPHGGLVDAGLAHPGSNFLLDVDHQTLRHRKYKNIFGLGDVNDLPTTKTFWAGFHQVHVVRNNIQRSLKGQTLNALYSGYTKSPLFLSQNELTYVVHYYNQKPSFQNMLFKNGGPIASLRYYFWAKQQKKRFLNWYLKKSWGPPTFKLKRRFSELPADKEAEQKSQGLFKALNKTTDATKDTTTNTGNTTADKVVEKAKETVGDVADRAKEAVRTVVDTAADVKDGAKAAVKENAEQVKDAAKDVKDAAKDVAKEAGKDSKKQKLKPSH